MNNFAINWTIVEYPNTIFCKREKEYIQLKGIVFLAKKKPHHVSPSLLKL